MKPRELVASSLRQNFHAAIMIVAHPPGDAQDVRLPFHKPAKSYTLDASAHQKPASLSNGLFRGTHRS